MTHLVQLLASAEPEASGIRSVTVWGGRPILDQMPARPWLTPVHEPGLDRSAASRLYWQQVGLARAAARSADVLFAPGGTYLGPFRPFVTMFRNMLPFDARERARYGLSGMRLKLALLRRAQAATFRRADGVIFLSEHARQQVSRAGIAVGGSQAVIPHGLDLQFFQKTAEQRPWSDFSDERPFRWLYVSAVHPYKHPWHVAEAAARLRRAGMPVSLAIVGPGYPPAMRRLEDTVRRVDPAGAFITVGAERRHADLPEVYRNADGFVFASTCENMPNILLEAMAASLPLVCSDRAPMPAILGEGGVFADPESPDSLADAMERLMLDCGLRARVAAVAQERARAYRWERCARDTFDFLVRVARLKPRAT